MRYCDPAWSVPEISLTAPLEPFVVRDSHVCLRPWAVGDLSCVADAAADPFIPTLTTVPAEFTTASGLGFIERQHARLRTGEGWALAIAEPHSDEAVGHIGLWLPQIRKGRAEIGYWIRPTARGHGFAAAALGLLSAWAFEHLTVHRLSLFIEPWNVASIRTAERADFTREALLEQWEVVGDEPKDMWCFVRLREVTN